MTMRGLLTSLVAALALTGCARPAPDARAQLSPAVIAGAPTALILMEQAGPNGLSATLIPAGTRDGVRVWRSADYQTLAFRDGQLIQTRGLGHDLMSADATGSSAALSGGPLAGYSRHMSFLDGDEGTVFRSIQCRMGPPTAASIASFGQIRPARLQVESCAGSGTSIENLYWRDAQGAIIATEQWIGPGLGMLRIEWLGGATARDQD